MAAGEKGIFRDLGALWVTAPGPQGYDDESWDAFCLTIKRLPAGANVRLLAIGDRPPNAAQRKKVNEAFEGRSAKVAVLSESHAVRVVLTALSWYGLIDGRAFGPRDLEGALAFLRVDFSPRELEKIVDEVRRSLG
jgi:hypothetical protein